MFWLLDAIERFIWLCMRAHICPLMLAVAKRAMTMQQQAKAKAASWRARGHRSKSRTSDLVIGLLRASQGQMGSCEIEPAIAV